MGVTGPLSDISGNFYKARLGSTPAIASGGANAILADCVFVAPANIKIVSAWKVAMGGSEVTVGTATSSASYRRHNLLNGGTGGAGTTIMASLNNTASNAQYTSKAFVTTANNTATVGALIMLSHLTVGAATADGTDAAASIYEIAYELL